MNDGDDELIAATIPSIFSLENHLLKKNEKIYCSEYAKIPVGLFRFFIIKSFRFISFS